MIVDEFCSERLRRIAVEEREIVTLATAALNDAAMSERDELYDMIHEAGTRIADLWCEITFHMRGSEPVAA